MRYRRLGNSGLSVSVVGLGANNFGRRLDEAATRAVVDAALDAGVNFVDTADIYGGTASEEFLGAALEGRRDHVVLATKFGAPMRIDGTPEWEALGSRRYVRAAVERSLRRLRTDYIDLYQFHFPDPETPIEETLSVLTDLVREGKVRYIGSSNRTAWQVADAEWVARANGLASFVSAQNEYSLLDRRAENELLPAAEHFGIGVLPYFPLASGLLTGKYRRGQAVPEGSRYQVNGMEDRLTGARFDAVEALTAFAEERGLSLLDVAVSGLAAQPAVASVIAGATSPEQVRANAAAGQWEPTEEDLVALDEIVPRGTLVG
ncbi:aldo/keto reductase [Marinitenerispora sediminis]|uniref:Aldo/keto reductase n=2 Tax=Marinitenerispora sediminis TaxID=1931232 RepID=A0A368SZR7_9ACTN|nr:aldo/keto reductase [Marinitenerispora sediminis]RCV49245.1 aldo/keto reductase [Marinitenerispora sediminis]RCV51697.1 aldo/keto reductase [Marinitenerispora sediminis]